MYQVLYRKWRPKVFADVVGQEHITTVLQHEIMEHRTSHAYLFTGSRGTGKTTCSRIFAKAVNCAHPVDGNPCLACDNCLGVENGSALDIVEIDAASMGGVDNIRELKEEAAFTPVSLRYRVYIIDETHMLSIGAFNALLKIMEEPPEHVIFILATTEAHKVPATIVSRCQRFDFNRIGAEKIAQRLLAISADEGISLTGDAAWLIAKLSDGAMRDAISLLDQCATQGGSIDEAVVGKAAGLAAGEQLSALTQALCARDSAASLQALQQMYERSVDCKRLCDELISSFRNLMIAKTVPTPDQLIVGTRAELERLQQLASTVGLNRIMDVLAVLQGLAERLPRSFARRTEFEMAVVRICSPRLSTDTDALLARIEALEQALASGIAVPAAASPQPCAPAAMPEQAVSLPQSVREVETVPLPVTEAPPPAPEGLQEFPLWAETLEKLSAINPPLRGTLNDSSAYVSGELLLVKCDNALFTRLIKQDDNSKAALKRALLAVTGKRYRLGPYTPDTVSKVLPSKANPMDEILQRAREAQIPVVEN